MERWFGIVALLLIAGLLAGLLVVLVGLKDEGVAIRLSGPIAIEGPTGPQEIHVVLEVPEGIQVEAGGEAEASLHTALEGIPCPNCHEGLMVPVRWNPFTGEITWRCPVCGHMTEDR